MKKTAVMKCPDCGHAVVFDAEYVRGKITWSGSCLNKDCPTQPYTPDKESLSLAKEAWLEGNVYKKERR